MAGSRLSALLVYLIMIGSMLLLTELMSNVALATMYIPVAIGIASGLGAITSYSIHYTKLYEYYLVHQVLHPHNKVDQ